MNYLQNVVTKLVIIGAILLAAQANAASGDLTVAGKFGVGTTTPGALAHLYDTTVSSDYIWFGSGNIAYPTTSIGGRALVGKGVTSDYRLAIQDGNGRVNQYWNAYRDSTVSSPRFIVSSEPASRVTQSVNGVIGGTWGFFSAAGGNAGDVINWTQLASMSGADQIWFSPRGINSDFFINNAGNVGIGTTSPTNKLHVSGANKQIVGSNGTDVAYLGASDGGAYIGSGGAIPLSLQTASTERARITAGGNLLVGTTADNGTDKLQVNGTVSAAGFTGNVTGNVTGNAGTVDNFHASTVPGNNIIPVGDSNGRIAWGAKPAFRGALVYGTLGITSAGEMRWFSRNYDTDNIWMSGAEYDHKFTVPSGVTKIKLSACLYYDPTTSVLTHYVSFLKNGALGANMPWLNASIIKLNNATSVDYSTMCTQTPVFTVAGGEYYSVSGEASFNKFTGWFSMEIIE